MVLALAAGGLAQAAWLLARARRSSGEGKEGVPLLAPWLGIWIAAGMAGWLKGLLNRPRPFEVIGGMGTASLEKGLSFPSGHATLAFALAAAVGLRWPRWRAVSFGLAAAVALSRVALGLHWPSDLLAGALLGWGVVSGVAWVERIWFAPKKLRGG